jgi:hypothetical protein
MNTKEFQELNNLVIPKVSAALEKLGDGNVIVELQNNQRFNRTTVYGISSVDGKPPYEAYELYNDGNSATWKYLGMTQ